MVYSKREKGAFYKQLTEEQSAIRLHCQKKRGYLKWVKKHKPDHPYFGVEFLLSDEQLLQLLREKGLTWSDVGKRNGTYQLGRFNDSGNYEVGNCRFILFEENRKEQYTKSEYNFRGKKYFTIPEIMNDTGLSAYLVRKELGLRVDNYSRQQERKRKKSLKKSLDISS